MVANNQINLQSMSWGAYGSLIQMKKIYITLGYFFYNFEISLKYKIAIVIVKTV